MREETRRILEDAGPLERLVSEQLPMEASEAPIERLQTVRVTDFEEIIEECELDAQRIVRNTAIFYIREEDIDAHARLRDKLLTDTQELSNLIFQSRAAKLTYVRLLEDIDAGNVHPRIFEVQAALQKSMMEITKSKTAYLSIMENSWRMIKSELEVLNPIDAEDLEGDAGNKHRGTRSLLKEIQGGIFEEEKKKKDNGTAAVVF